ILGCAFHNYDCRKGRRRAAQISASRRPVYAHFDGGGAGTWITAPNSRSTPAACQHDGQDDTQRRRIYKMLQHGSPPVMQSTSILVPREKNLPIDVVNYGRAAPLNTLIWRPNMTDATVPLRKIDHVRFFVGNARQSAYF